MEASGGQRSDRAPPDLPLPPGLASEMLGVAGEASRAGDFQLAAEIYGSRLAQRPERALCLRRAEALARAGRLAEALDSYAAAAALARLRPEELRPLVEGIALGVREKALRLPAGAPPERGGGGGGSDLFSCPGCRRLLLDPATLPCGHTFCKCCPEGRGRGECPLCGGESGSPAGAAAACPGPSQGARVNVLLGNLLEKWFETESRVRKLCVEGDVLRQQQDLTGALGKYDQAAELAPSDCFLRAQRAELCMAMEDYEQALCEVDAVCRNKPLWPEGHYVKARALSAVGRREEALKEFFYCVALNPNWSLVKKEAQKIMCEMFFPAFENVRDSLAAPFHATSSYTRLKPTFLCSISTSTREDGSSAGGLKNRAEQACDDGVQPCALLLPAPNAYAGTEDFVFRLTKVSSQEGGLFGSAGSSVRQHTRDLQLEDTKTTLGKVLSGLPAASLKRKLASSSELQSLETLSKVAKQDEDIVSEHPASTSKPREIPVVLADASDFECSLCMRLFYEPVATPCGHTFCLKCLERCLDHNPHCPLCKENLSEYLATRAYKKTLLTEELIVRYFPEELAERKKVYEEEMKELSNLTKDVPIFVCTMAFPTIPCPLYVFEPRYRLMIRRSMETGTKQFGMCIADELKGFADYGCMLEVRDVKFFPDGRSVVDTVGLSRFRVLSHGQRDGYNTANIEYLSDKKSNASGPAWCWWLLAVLPLENKAQLTILAMTSLANRLLAIRRVLMFVTRKRPR
ncbi:LON peptidase N-terminal domain and RING finger protein 2 isoform X2 [Rhinatrema bivittatum]|uniref:LON peptidase N-terminal domain and RING finger protein 2 isoform X2 n=1 Tax=Rhinatrema bivittatum TaxID=194408 RepID=UPI00112E13E9|nr:LON peptidase N-terminal domain and RING finger protein 2 isoform X2 [Rhinatrema bivittatum]